MKRLLTFFALAVCSLTIWAQASMSGSGTESDPYKIYYADQLHQVRNYLNQDGVVFKLMNDIDITQWNEVNNPGQGWEPIGVQSAPFKGVFDGNNKKITGFSITRASTDYVGFFGYISGATIKNLTIEGPVTGHQYVGAFVGYGTGDCTLTGLTHNGTITAYTNAGHIVGEYGSSLSNVSATGDVNSTSGLVGGIIGYQNATGKTIWDVKMTGNVTCSSNTSQYIGGIVGYSRASISVATYSGNVSGGCLIGGITGQSNAAVNLVTVNGSVTGTNTSNGKIGGIAGANYSSISDARITGNVTGYTLVGGICGYSSNSVLTSCRADGDVTGTANYVGGICGQSQDGTITNCYSNGDVTTSGSYVGGVLGQGVTAISHSSSFGNVSGASYVGGVIGSFEKTLEIPEFNHYYRRSSSSSTVDFSKTDELKDATTSEKSISNCYAVGNVFASGSYVGGICGSNNNCYSWTKTQKGSITLTSSDYSHYVMTKGVKTTTTGTFTAYYYTPTITFLTLSDNYFSGDLQGQSYVGGVVGLGNHIKVKQNYSNATIKGTSYVGGIIGSIQWNTQTLQYYPYNSASPSSATYSGSVKSELKSNMAVNTSVTATDNAGRIYGSKETSGVTVGVNSNAAEDNRALYEGRLIISGVTQEVSDSEQNGVNNGISYFKLRANYVAHGWDVNSNWTILDTETFPYKPWQAAPPTISSDLVSGGTSMSGNSTDGGTVYVKVGKNAEVSATCSGTSWTLSGLPAFKSGDQVSLYAEVSDKEKSYRTQAVVGFPGSGTEADPWRVYTADDLQGVYKNGYYKQMNDINLASWISANNSTDGWVPVGYSGTEPIVYDGDNHKVTGLWVNSTENYSGLFSYFSNGTIRNLTVEATTKKVKGVSFVGVLIGRIGTGTIENVKVNGSVSASGNYAGVVTGLIGRGSMENVTATGDASGYSYVGGIAGFTNGTTLNKLLYSGTLTATGDVGGITSYSSALVTNCEVKDLVINASGSDNVGGLVAYPVNEISNCKVTGTINQTGTRTECYVGGIASANSQNITECYTNVTINNASPQGQTAGLVANLSGSAAIKRCSSAGSVTSTGTGAYTGGLVALTTAYNTIEDCYSAANATGTLYTAGLVAYNKGTINRCYTSGDVVSVYNGAGVVCENDGASATTTNCVALGSKVELSDQTGWGVRVVGNFKNDAAEPDKSNLFAWEGMQVSVNGVPKTVPDNNLDGTAITSAQTKSQDTYDGLYWDFDNVWTMVADGYPELKWLATQTEPEVMKGDLNGDGKVSITDVVIIVDVIAGLITDENLKAAADVNNDGRWSVTDCVGAIDLIAAQQASGSRSFSSRAMSSNTDYINATMQDNLLNVSLDNERRYTAFQMVVTMPEGMTLGKATMDKMRGEDHTVTVRSLGNGQYLVAGFSADNDELTGTTGCLFSASVNGQAIGDIVISDVEFATTDAEGYRLADAVVGTTTGICSIENGELTIENCYDLQGRRVEGSRLMVNGSGLKKGLYIMNGKKVTIK